MAATTDSHVGRCGPCGTTLEHDKCRRHDGERCGCPDTNHCGQALAVPVDVEPRAVPATVPRPLPAAVVLRNSRRPYTRTATS